MGGGVGVAVGVAVALGEAPGVGVGVDVGVGVAVGVGVGPPPCWSSNAPMSKPLPLGRGDSSKSFDGACVEVAVSMAALPNFK